MGGHANGQDASRLAIQTIINYMVPPLSEGNDMGDEDFVKLLADGVQQANAAVYKHNQEQRGDMGTTMTASLVIGSMAYVAKPSSPISFPDRNSTRLNSSHTLTS